MRGGAVDGAERMKRRQKGARESCKAPQRLRVVKAPRAACRSEEAGAAPSVELHSGHGELERRPEVGDMPLDVVPDRPPAVREVLERLLGRSGMSRRGQARVRRGAEASRPGSGG